MYRGLHYHWAIFTKAKKIPIAVKLISINPLAQSEYHLSLQPEAALRALCLRDESHVISSFVGVCCMFYSLPTVRPSQ